MKNKMAIWTPGGVGAGIQSQGFPSIVKIVDHLSTQYEIHVYMHARPNLLSVSGFVLHSSPSWMIPSVLRWLYLVLLFTRSDIKKKHNAILSFWGYPSGTIAVVLGKLFHRPSAVFILGGEAANLPEINYGLLRKSLVKKIVLWTCAKTDLLLAISHYQLDQLKMAGLTRYPRVIPWGADKNLFFAIKKKRELPLKIIHVANLNPVKDQRTLLLAFNSIRKKIDARLRIVGVDVMNGKIQELVKQLGIEHLVEFTGGLPYHQIPEQFAWADLFILTSRSEGQNNSITEAMMCGLLAVSTSVGIMADLGNDRGIVVDIGDYQTLADEVVAIWNNPEAWGKKVSNALRWSKTHDLTWTLQQLDLCFEQLRQPN